MRVIDLDSCKLLYLVGSHDQVSPWQSQYTMSTTKLLAWKVSKSLEVIVSKHSPRACA